MVLIAALTGVPKAVFTGAVGVAVFGLALRRLPPALVATVAALAAGSSSEAWIKYTFSSARWGAVFGLLAALLLLARRTPLMGGEPVLAALIAIPFFSAAWSIDRRLTLERAVSFAALLIVIWLLVRLARSRSGIKAALVDGLAWLPVIALVASLIVLAFDRVAALRGHEFRGFFENPNGLGLFVGLTFPFALGAVDRRRGRSRSIALLALGAAIVTQVSNSRSGLLALVVGVAVYEAGRRQWRRLGIEFAVVVAVVGVALVVSAITPSSSTTGISSLVDRSGGLSFVGALTGARNEAWSATASLIGHRPVLGYGFGMGDQVFGRYPKIAHFTNFQGGLPENAYLQLLLELGFVGAALYLGVLIAAAVGVYRAVREGISEIADAAFAAAAAASLLALVVESVLEAAGAPWSLLAWLAFILVIRWPGSVRQVAYGSVAPPRRSRLSFLVTASTNPEPQMQVARLQPSWAAVAVALVLGLGVGVGAYAIRDRHTHPSDAARARADGEAIGLTLCTARPCAEAEVSEGAPGFWLIRIATRTRSVTCYLVQLERFSLSSRQPLQGVAPTPCTNLPLRTPDVLTVGMPSSAGLTADQRRNADFDAQVVRLLASHLGIPRVRFVDVPPGLRRSQLPNVDVVSGVTTTPSLTRLGRLSSPYYYAHLAILELRQRSGGAIESVAAVRNVPLGVYDAATLSFAEKSLHAQHVLSFGTRSAAIAALLRHRVQALVVDSRIAAPIASSIPGRKVTVAGVAPEISNALALLFPRGSMLRALVDTQIATMINDGSLARVRERWYPGLAKEPELKSG